MKVTPQAARPNWANTFPAPWPAIWAWIFLAIVVLGLATPHNFTLTFIKIGGIFLCFVYALRIFPKDHLLQLALLVTFCADIILAVNNTAEAGVLVFLVAQILHTMRLEGKNYITQIISFAGLAVVTMIINLVWQVIPMMYLICGFYIVAIVTNIYVSWRWWRQNPQNLQAFCGFLGFLLFLCCDACTGISYLSLNQMFPAFLYAPANFFAWFFYYPSQILVSNSSKYATMKQRKVIVLQNGGRHGN